MRHPRIATATPIAIVIALAVMLGPTAAAQLASRPAGEWSKVLDSPDRLANLKADEVIAALKLKPTDVVADLGAGTGPFVVPFAKAVSSGRVYAVEIDKEFFPRIQEKAKAAGVANVQTVLGAFTDPQLPARDLDVAFMHDVLHHVENRAAYVKNLAAYLKPTARVAIIDYHPAQSPHQDQPSMQVSREQARTLLADAGFTQVDEIALFTDKWFIVARR